MRLVTSLHLSLPPPVVTPGHLEANHTLEGAGGSITSVDFDPSVRPPSSMGYSPPQVYTWGMWGLWDLREYMGILELGSSPLGPETLACLPAWGTWMWEALRQPWPGSGLRPLLPPSLQGSQLLAATYNQAAQLWKVGEAQSKVRCDEERAWGSGVMPGPGGGAVESWPCP